MSLHAQGFGGQADPGYSQKLRRTLEVVVECVEFRNLIDDAFQAGCASRSRSALLGCRVLNSENKFEYVRSGGPFTREEMNER